jgi:transposase
MSKTLAQEPEWAAFVAIDWADQKHVWALAEAESGKQEHGELTHTPEAVDVWAMDLYRRFGGRPVALCLEQKRGALVAMLAKYPHLVLFAVHPKTAANYRETFCPSGAKSDNADAAMLLDLLLRHRDQLRELLPDTVETRLLQSLVQTRRRLVDDRTRQSNRLTASLKIYFPQVLVWFDDVQSPLVAALLERWPTLQELRRSHPGTLRKFFHQHNCRNEDRIRERIDGIREAMVAVEDPAILEGESRKAQILSEVIQVLRKHIAVLDERIAELVAAHPDGELFASLPGAGPVLTARLIAAFGSRRERFESAQEMAELSGIAPITISSGKTKHVCKRIAYAKFLGQTFHEYANHSRAKSEWARLFYEFRQEQGQDHHPILRCLGYKWIRIAYRCWKDRRPYDEQVYIRSLQCRNSPLAGAFAPATPTKCKTVAGFKKLS